MLGYLLHAQAVAVRKQGALASTSGNNVVAKVVEMLQNEKGKIVEDMKEETAEMDEYLDYCKTEQSDKNYAIKQSTRKIEDLTAAVEQSSAKVDAFNEQIAELGVEMADEQEDLDKAAKLRQETHEEFKVREQEQMIMVGELEQMEQALMHQMMAMTTPPPVPGSVPAGEEAFLQVSSSNDFSQGVAKYDGSDVPMVDIARLRELMTRTVNAFGLDPQVASGNSGAFLQAPTQEITMSDLDHMSDTNKANLDAFKGLKGKAEKALQRERDYDAESQHDFMMDKQAILKTQEILQNKIDEAKAGVQTHSEIVARSTKDRTVTEESRAADMKFLQVLTTECQQASDAWDERQQSAKDEQAAIDKACEILESRATVFLQISRTEHMVTAMPSPGETFDRYLSAAHPSSGDDPSSLRQKLITHFRQMGPKLSSVSMLTLVSAASAQPFEKITGLIKQLIENLKKEAAADATQQAFCNAERKKNKESMEKITGRLDKLGNRLDGHTSRKDELVDSIAELTAECQEIDESDAEAEKIRQEQHETFVKAEADFKEATAAVEDAINVLRDFYGDVSIGALVQVKSASTSADKPKAAPKMGSAKSASAGGILSIMDMMASNFAKTVSELQSTEHEAQASYEKTKNDNEVAKASKQAEIKASKSEVSSLTVAIGETGEDKDAVEKELAALEEYMDKIKGTCANKVVSYEERKKKRAAEIEGLKEALKIMIDTSNHR